MEILTSLFRMFADMWDQFAGVYDVCMTLGMIEPLPCARTAAISVWSDYGAVARPAIIGIVSLALAAVLLAAAIAPLVVAAANSLTALFLDPPHR
jgi:hypothetical protein